MVSNSHCNTAKGVPQLLVESLAVTLGKTLNPVRRTLVAEDRQDRLQQLPPLRITKPPGQAAIGQRLEGTDQISCSSGVLERRGQEIQARPAHQTGAECPAPWLLGHIFQ